MTAETCRGQLVLIAALALAVALVPLLLAYVQLGYSEDLVVQTGGEPAEEIERTLEHELNDVTSDLLAEDGWDVADALSSELRNRLAPTLDTINRSHLDAGTAISVSYNQTRAAIAASSDCPHGPDRQFNENCQAIDGVIIQERAGKLHVLGVAVDIEITGTDGETRLTTVIPA